MYSKVWGPAAAIIGLLAGFAPKANAQTASAAANTGADSVLTEVVVTARRTQELAQDVPQSVLGISAVTLQSQEVQTFNDLQYVAPGLNLIGGFTGGYINPSIRGQYQSTNASGTQPGVSTYFAEIYAPTQPAQLYDLVDVEVLKGPQGTLFGRNSTGGAVLIQPARPDTGIITGYVKQEFGNLHYYDTEGAINIPIISGKLAIRVAADKEARNGYTHDLFNGTTLDGNTFAGSRVSILFTPTDNIENYTVYTESHYHTEPSNFIYANACADTPTAPACFYNSPFISSQFGGRTLDGAFAQQAAVGNRNQYTDAASRDDQDNVLLANTTTYTMGDFKLRNIFGYVRSRIWTNFDEDGTDLPILADLPGIPAGKNYLNEKQYSDEAQILGDVLNHKLTFVGGYYYFRSYSPTGAEGFGYTQFQGVSPETPAVTTTNQSILSNAVYAHASYEFGDVSPQLDGLSLTAGYRYTWDKLDSSSSNYAYLQPENIALCTLFATQAPYDPATCRTFQDARFRDPSYDISLQYKLNANAMVYLATRRGYRAGGFNANSTQPEFSAFHPEHITDYEIGLKSEFSYNGISGRFNIDAYTGKYSDIQRSIPTFQNGISASYTENAAGARINGIELETAIIPVKGLTISLNYALTDAHYTTFIYNGVSLAGGPLALTPRNVGSVTGTYKFPLPDELGAVSISGTYFAQSQYSLSDLTPQIETQGVAAGYSKVDARLEWADIYRTALTVALWGKNLTDRSYVTGGTAAATALGYDWVQWSVPRTYGVSAMYKF